MTKKKLVILIVAIALFVAAALTTTLILVLGGDDSTPSNKNDWPETGVYYYDAKYDEYTLTLNSGDKFVLLVKGEISFGSYTLSDGKLTLDFDEESKENIDASLADGVISLSYGGSSMRFLKKVNYTFSFNTNGGSDISSVTVVNGRTADKPADPVRPGYLFVGWYKDAEFKTPFSFDTESVSADTTVYARWSEVGSGSFEYNVSFDLNYDNAPAIDAIKTYGGKVVELPSPTRDGYTFGGWWISMTGDSAKLSYEYKNTMELFSSETLYALWLPTASAGTKLPAPVATVGRGSVSWNAVNGARSYNVKITNANGTVVLETDTATTTLNVPFDTYAAGEYTVKVTALANSGDSNNSDCVRYYVNKALPKVSLFNVVEPAILNFNTVAGAEKYLITVICGNSAHSHTLFDNGLSRSFNFANCDMSADGIKFTVTAVADGYASSTSETFVFKRELTKVEGLRIDEATETVYWNEVPAASGYMVSVKCGNTSHNHGFVNNGTALSVSLKECSPFAEGITVKVYPVTKGYISPEPTELNFNKTKIATPSELRINALTLSWAAVAGASEYEVKVGASVYKVSTNSFDLSDAIDWVEGAQYSLSVRALGESESLWSDEINALYLDKPAGLNYYGGILSWNPVIGAESYEVQVGDGQAVTVNGGATYAEITLTKAGINEVKVRFVDGANYSDWAVIEVFAHTITFDTREGNQIAPQYKAVGDKITLPTPSKTGYNFVAWYNVPGGPLSNGRLYNDTVYSESGSIVLYAYYTAIEVNVVLNAGAEAGGEKFSDKISFEEYYQLAIPTPTSPTMAFGGWYSAPYGMGNAYTDAKGNSHAPWQSLESVELHAFWIDYALEFTLTKINGADVYMVSAGERISMLDEVTVPANFNNLPVAMVAGSAFKNCTSLKVINLPDTISQISLVDPFVGCTALEAVNVYSVSRSAPSRYWSEGGVLFDNGTGSVAEPKLLFMPLAKTGSYKIPSGIVEIPSGAFSNSKLSRVTVPASVTKIGSEAFANCANLTSVTFEAVEGAEPLTIAARAFMNCASLEKITLPKRLATIPLTKYSVTENVVSFDTADNAFLGCYSLNSINVASQNSSYKSLDGVIYSADGKMLLFCPSVVFGSFSIPAGTQTIAPGAFVGCYGITEVTIPNTVTAVGDYAFYGLKTSFSKVTFSGNGFNEVSVGKYAFGGCSNLTTVAIQPGSRISVFDEGAFYATAITELEIPATVTRIGKNAFHSCAKLEKISFADNGKPLAFEEGVFSGCASLKTVHIPSNVSEIPGIFNDCISLESVTVDENNPNFESDGGVVFNKGKTEILFFPRGKEGEYTVPATVTSLSAGVFSYVTNIERLILPNTLTSIGDSAFLYSEIPVIEFSGNTFADELHIGNRAFESTSKLKTLCLPAHTKSLGNNAFTGSAITNITLNDGLLTIGEYAFSSTLNLFEITIPGSVTSIGDYCFGGLSVISSITLNEGISSIGKHAFENTYYITSITIPASVTKIDDYAFSGAGLTSITFAFGSKLEVIGAYAFSRTHISSITIPGSVAAIGAYAFYYCTSLQSVTFDEGNATELVIGTPYEYTHKDQYTENMITEILVGHVFENATRLSNVIFPSRLTEIKARSFESAGSAVDSLSVSFGENSALTTIGEYCFYNSSLTSITIPASVRNLEPVVNGDFGLTYDRLGIGKYAFAASNAEKNKLTLVTFELGGNEPITIGEGAFANTAGLTSITLPKRLAPYVRANEETVPGLVGGAEVFKGADALTAVFIEDSGAHYADKDGIVYTADFTELIFCPSGYVGEASVPASVTKIHSRAFFGCDGVTSITFEGGTDDMTIESYAFAGCENITEIALPSNAVSLGERAFSGCTRLESITLSEHIDRFDGSMIENCPSLKNIIVGEGNSGFFYDNGALYTADKTVLILYTSSRTEATFTAIPTTVKILNNAFAGNVYLTEVILPEGLVEIGASAFTGCTSLNKIVIPSTVELICEKAFEGCTSLASPQFEKGGEAPLLIGDLAFTLSGISSVELPKRTASLGNEVFLSSSLSTVTFESGSMLESMGNRVFVDTKISEISLPEGLISIGDSLFEGSKATRVFLPSTLKNMGINTFKDCKSLTEVSFAPNSQIEILPYGTFSRSSIVTVTIPRSLMLIQNKEYGNFASYGAFEGCSSLSNIIFEENGRLHEIGQNAFYGCTSLKEIVIPSSVSTIGYLAFYGCTALESVTIPQTATSLGHSLFYGCTSLKNVVLESKTTELPTNMFYGCESLTSITIPSNVSTIGENCFYGTSMEEYLVAEKNTSFASRDGILYSGDLSRIIMYPSHFKAESITIPKEVVTIEADIFSGATTLKKVIFEDGGTAALTIDAYAFENCYRLNTVILPERLQTIGASAFENCFSLVTITIPSTVKRIDNYAFNSCYKLVEVYNKSELNVKVNTNNGSVGYYALNIYTPNSGESIINIDSDGYVTAELVTTDELTGEPISTKYLISYMGSEKNLSLPNAFDAFYSYAFYRLDGIESIFIPESAGRKIIGKNVFSGCGKPSLLFEAGEIPSSWGSLWNDDGCPVLLGYDGEEHTYSFVTGSDETVPPITSSFPIALPTLQNVSGKKFAGWYSTSDFSGAPITGSYYSATATTLYALWVNDGEEIPTAPDGTSFDTAFEIELGKTNDVLIDVSNEKVYFKFTPTVSGIYHAYVSGSTESTLKVHTAPSQFDVQGSYYADSINPIIDINLPALTAGSTYYFSVYLASDGTAELAFTFTFTEESGDEGGGDSTDEGGSDFDNAILLENNKESSALIESAGGSAYFKFTPAKDGKFNVYVYGTNAVLTIYDSDRTTVIDTFTNTSVTYGDKDVLLELGVTYYLTVTVPTDSFRTYVKVKEVVENPGTSTPDTDTGFDDATTLIAGEAVTVQFSAANQKIYYVYTATKSGNHTIKINSGSNQCWLSVYGSDKTEIGYKEYDTFGVIEKTVSLNEAETYYFVVSMLYNPGSLEFTLSAPKNEESGGGSLVGGTGFDDAIEIIPSTTYDVSCDTYGKKVYFKYTAEKTGAYHVYVSGNSNAMLQIYKDEENTNQPPVYASWGTGVIDKDLSEFTEGNTYYIIVSVSGGTADLEFTLTAPEEQ